MSWLRRILEGNGQRYIAGGLSMMSHVLLGLFAWRGSMFAVVVLVISAVFWTGMAVMTGVHWRRTLRSWEVSLHSWDETQKLAVNYADLLLEACDVLSTWDEERANEIISRTRTISGLRQKNLNERMGEP